MLNEDLLRLEPWHRLAAAVLAQAVVLGLPLILSLLTAARSHASHLLSLPEPAWYSRQRAPGHLKDLQTAPQQDGCVSSSVGIRAHNEEANIGHRPRSHRGYRTPSIWSRRT